MNNGLAQAIGTGISVVPLFFLVFDSVITVMQIGPMQDSFVQRGYPVDSAVTIGLLALVCIASYVVPRTSVFGAIDAPIFDSLSRRQLPRNRSVIKLKAYARYSACRQFTGGMPDAG